jgi:hypothetical protein
VNVIFWDVIKYFREENVPTSSIYITIERSESRIFVNEGHKTGKPSRFSQSAQKKTNSKR